MWGPTEKCTGCGGTTIRECDDGDPAVGYSSVDWRCMDCGEICEEWTPEAPAAASTRRPSTVATIADDIAAALFIPARKPAAVAPLPRVACIGNGLFVRVGEPKRRRR